MKRKNYLIIAISFLAILRSTESQAQEILNIQYFKHIQKQKPKGGNAFPSALINENGWLFLRTDVTDSFQFENMFIDKGNDARILFAFDEKGNKKWHLKYDSTMTERGGCGFVGSAKNSNQIIISGGALNYLQLPGMERQTFSGQKYFLANLDSNGRVVKYILNESINFGAGTFNYSDHLITTRSLDKSLKAYDLTLNKVIDYQLPINSSQRSAILDKDGNTYVLLASNPKNTQIISDSSFLNTSDGFKWYLFKLDQDKKILWHKEFDNNVQPGLNDNKLLRIDKYNQLFVSLHYRKDMELEGISIPFMDEPFPGQTKSVILRYNSKDGNLISAHFDRYNKQAFQGIDQTVWLELDHNDEMYAYLYSGGRLDSFDQVYFNETNYDAHRILWWNQEKGVFDQSFTHKLGRMEMSLIKTRFALWSSHGFNNTVMTGGIEVNRRWDDDFIISVFDTAQSPETIKVNGLTYEIAKVRVFPNPTKGLINIQNQESENVQITIYDIQMKLINQISLNPNETKALNLNNISGSYIIHCQSETGKISVHKVIKQ